MKHLLLAFVLGLTFSFSGTTESTANQYYDKTYKGYTKKQRLYIKRCRLSKYRKYRNYRKYCRYAPKPRKAKVIQKKTKAPSVNYHNDDNSAASFFRRDRARMSGVSYSNSETQPLSYTSTQNLSYIYYAKKWEGYHARTNRAALRNMLSKYNKRRVDPAITAWCAAFANAVLKKSGRKGTGSLLARSFLKYGSKTRNPKKGDIVVFARGRRGGHVGFYMGEKIIRGVKYVKVLGGNQSRRVSVALYPARRVLSYRSLG